MEIKTKYSIDQEVWFMKENKVQSAIIDKVDVERWKSGHQIERYGLNEPIGLRYGADLYESKEELLNAL
jgi:hypothetical protein